MATADFGIAPAKDETGRANWPVIGRQGLVDRLSATLYRRATSKRRSPTRTLAKAASAAIVVSRSPAARGRRIRALCVFFLWQLWRRTARRSVQTVLAKSYSLALPPWSRSAGLILSTGFPDYHDQGLLWRVLKQSDVFVDVGANLGSYSMLAAARQAHVIAFEPSPDAAAALRRNVALNCFEVQVNEVAVSNETGTVQFTSGLDIGNSIMADQPRSAHCVPVDSTRLDDVDLPPVGQLFIKIDAEGFDVEVLKGASKTIAERLPVVLIEVWDGGAMAIEALPSGYIPLHWDEPTRLLSVGVPWHGQGNLLLCHIDRLALLCERIRSGPTLPRGGPQIRPTLRK